MLQRSLAVFGVALTCMACGDGDAAGGAGGASQASGGAESSGAASSAGGANAMGGASSSGGAGNGGAAVGGAASGGSSTGGGPPADLCAGYPSVINVDLPWGNGQQVTTGSLGGFPWDAVIAGRIVVPADAAVGSLLGTMVVAEYQGPPTTRAISLSTVPCDFRDMTAGAPTDLSSVTHPMAWNFGNTASINFTVGPGNGTQPTLLPGSTYYLNVQNYSLDLMGNSCSSMTTCDAVLNVSPPNN